MLSFGVALQVGMLVCLCGFIYVIVKLMFKDVSTSLKPINEKPKANEVALVVLDAADKYLVNKKITFSGKLTLGRASSNIVVLDDKFASHFHAVITPVQNLYEIEDLNSKNHTYINDEVLVGKTFLKDGDVIRIGGVTFRFER